MKSGTLYATFLVARYFFFLACFSIVILAVMTLRKRQIRTGEQGSMPTLAGSAIILTSTMRLKRMQKATVWISTLTLILGVVVGYASRDHQLASNTLTYTDVSITKRISDRDFWVWPDRMKQMHVQTCHDVGWKAGDVLDDWTFEQRNGCKRVISYHQKETTNAEISTR